MLVRAGFPGSRRNLRDLIPEFIGGLLEDFGHLIQKILGLLGNILEILRGIIEEQKQPTVDYDEPSDSNRPIGLNNLHKGSNGPNGDPNKPRGTNNQPNGGGGGSNQPSGGSNQPGGGSNQPGGDGSNEPRGSNNQASDSNKRLNKGSIDFILNSSPTSNISSQASSATFTQQDISAPGPISDPGVQMGDASSSSGTGISRIKRVLQGYKTEGNGNKTITKMGIKFIKGEFRSKDFKHAELAEVLNELKRLDVNAFKPRLSSTTIKELLDRIQRRG